MIARSRGRAVSQPYRPGALDGPRDMCDRFPRWRGLLVRPVLVAVTPERCSPFYVAPRTSLLACGQTVIFARHCRDRRYESDGGPGGGALFAVRVPCELPCKNCFLTLF